MAQGQARVWGPRPGCCRGPCRKRRPFPPNRLGSSLGAGALEPRAWTNGPMEATSQRPSLSISNHTARSDRGPARVAPPAGGLCAETCSPAGPGGNRGRRLVTRDRMDGGGRGDKGAGGWCISTQGLSRREPAPPPPAWARPPRHSSSLQAAPSHHPLPFSGHLEVALQP